MQETGLCSSRGQRHQLEPHHGLVTVHAMRIVNTQKKLQAGSDWIELAVASLNNSWGILIFQVKLVIGL